MKKHTKKHMRQWILFCVVITLFVPFSAQAGARPVGFMPGVTEEMTNPVFWSDLTDDPDAILATPEDIARINAAAEAAEGVNRVDLRNVPALFALVHAREVGQGIAGGGGRNDLALLEPLIGLS